MGEILLVKASSQPLSDRIHTYLRQAIINNEIKPRNIIREKDIAGVFDSSTTPVREAIKRLASEGFVEVHPLKNFSTAIATFCSHSGREATQRLKNHCAHIRK